MKEEMKEIDSYQLPINSPSPSLPLEKSHRKIRPDKVLDHIKEAGFLDQLRSSISHRLREKVWCFDFIMSFERFERDHKHSSDQIQTGFRG